MSEEFKLEDDAPTMQLDGDDSDNAATMPLDDEAANAADSEPNLDINDEEEGDANLDEEEEEEDQAVVRRAAPASEGTGVGAFTAMLILSFLIYAAAAAICIYQISQYSAPDAFGWKAPMP